MSNSTNGMSLSKTENKLLLPLIMYGSKTKRELSLATDLQAEKIDEALSALINKGLIQYDEENKVYFSVLPVKRIIDLLDQSASEIESKRKNQSEKFQQFNKIIEENLEQFRISFETQLNEFKTSSNQLQVSLEEEFDTSEERQIKNATELAETLLSSFQTSVVESQTNFQTFLSSESTRFEKEELSSVIKSVTEKTESVQTQLSEVLAEIGTVSASQLQQFYTNVESIAEEFKTNLSTGLNESWKHEKEFVNEIRNHVQSTLEDKIVKALQNVVKNLSKELDEGINDALNNVKLQTNSAIKESSNQIKEEFKEFVENATELIQEQRTSLNVLNTEISEISSEKKLSGQRDHFLNQLNAHLSADLSVLETNYRKAQNTATDILENIRQSAKKRMIQQSNAFEELLLTFISEIEKSISRKNKDIENLQRISQSSTQFLNNLMVSIPMKTNQYKTSLKDSIDNTISELQEAINETPLNPVNEIYNLLNSSQKRVEAEFKETFEENQREIQNVINASEQLNNTVSNLQETYLEKIEHRFEQRAKVMNTELEAFTRNFQQVLNGIESGFGDINERLQLNIGSVDNIEISLENSVSQLKNEVDHVFTQNKTNTSEFISELDNNLQNHIDRILDVIREGFGQIKTEFNTEIEKQLEQLNSNSEVQQSSLLTTIDSFFNHSHGYITDFRSSILRAFEENQNELVDSINENRKGTDEVISKYQESIAKYQEKGPLDILSFINQIESEVSNQNKNVKDSMDELASYYNGLSEVSMNEVSGLVRQVNESGDKLSAVVNDYLQIVSNSLTKTADKIDLYYTDTTTEVENQVN
ncbi:MAG: helix-turn-helix domain-containing protein, partial [Candidatus Hodarchaeales archaeon]